ncbi:rod shape-determining protein MreC [Sporobacter termitidis DSM 10068]|uniref:Cell shape-determining protein MreC n=1 Tax=Sporobacter termitidis DSM 10068 TaxID=1123282 RepID=A0A1M5VN45_9FIRM|nr:rod shape-determining protein MreC [Sporobacter termitidis]SHH76635.1 rod shape-determining protein MreC [Sporobacter termitidis DSM 10068]
MRRFLKPRVIGFLAIAVVIAAVTIISVNTRGNSGFITNSLMSLSKPLKSAASSVAKTFESFYGYMYKYEQLEQENKELKAKLYKQTQDNQNVDEISKENDDLHALFDFSSRHPDYTQYDMAEVISWSSSNWDSSFTIDKGSSNSKIKAGDCVITEVGALVGVVSEVGANSSTVITVVDTKFSYGAYIERNDERAVATGDFTLMKQGLLKLSYLQDTTEIVTGDTIITSGNGGTLPAKLVIGSVQEVLTDPTGISRYATIKPAADLTSLSNVFLITSYQTTESGG